MIVYILTRNINDTISSVVSTLKHKEQAKQEIIELEKEDFKNFTLPENNLHCYQMQVFKNGNAIYNAFGKHTSEEFWTEEFSLHQLTQ